MDLPSLSDAAPPTRGLARVRAYADMWLKDHGFIRDLYFNLHRISDKAWRSAQPGPRQIGRVRDLGIRTIVNLRGRRDTCGSYILEREAAAAAGLTLVDFPLRSRSAWEKPTLHAAARLFDTLEYPVLFHCKSGADRAGMMATLYLFLHEGLALETAMGQMSLRFGHVKWGPTGIIDHFYEAYAAHARAREAAGDRAIDADPRAAFLAWVDQDYDPAALNAAFKSTGLGKVLVDDILRRE